MGVNKELKKNKNFVGLKGAMLLPGPAIPLEDLSFQSQGSYQEVPLVTSVKYMRLHFLKKSPMTLHSLLPTLLLFPMLVIRTAISRAT